MSKREALVDTAKKLLWVSGYEAMSPRDVQSASGAGQGSMYHHFSGKLDLAAAALVEIEEEMHADFDAIFNANTPPLARIFKYLSLERIGTRGCRLGRLANEAAIAEERLRQPVARYFGHVERVIKSTLAEAIGEGVLSSDVDPGVTAHMLVAVVQGGFVLSRVHQDANYVRRATKGARLLIENLRTN